MSRYTTELRFICEQYAGKSESQDRTSINDIIMRARTKVFDFNYPIFDQNYKSVLETKIIKHYYTREIGMETVGLWKLKLEARMNEIMPYYNELYRALNFMDSNKYDPFATVDMKTNRDVDISESGSGTSSGKGSETSGTKSDTDVRISSTANDFGDEYDKYSDTPQGSLDGVESGNYLTNARKIENQTHHDESQNTSTTDTSSSNSSSTSTGEYTNTLTNSQDYIEHVYGRNNSKTQYQIVSEMVNQIVNVDSLIIADLSDLFFGLWM